MVVRLYIIKYATDTKHGIIISKIIVIIIASCRKEVRKIRGSTIIKDAVHQSQFNLNLFSRFFQFSSSSNSKEFASNLAPVTTLAALF